MPIPAVEVDDEGVCGPKAAQKIVDMKHTKFYDVQNPKSPYFDKDFPRRFRFLPKDRGEKYVVRELRDYVRLKAAKRNAGGV